MQDFQEEGGVELPDAWALPLFTPHRHQNGQLYVWTLKVCRYFLAVLCSMWDLSSLTRDQTRPPALEAGVLTTGLLGKSAGWSSFTLFESK